MSNIKNKTDIYIAKLKSGDAAAFDMLYETCFSAMYRVAYSILLSNADAEDITQDTFVTILKHLDNIDVDGNAWSYILTTLKNKSFNLIAKKKRTIGMDEKLENVLYSDYGSAFDTPALDAAKKILEPEDLSLVIMCSVKEYTLKEVAQILNKPLSTVHYRYKCALKSIENELNKGGKNEKNKKSIKK